MFKIFKVCKLILLNICIYVEGFKKKMRENFVSGSNSLLNKTEEKHCAAANLIQHVR